MDNRPPFIWTAEPRWKTDLRAAIAEIPGVLAAAVVLLLAMATASIVIGAPVNFVWHLLQRIF